MADVIEEKKLSLIKKYPMETLVLVLIAAVGFLIVRQTQTEKKVDQLQNEMKQYLSVDHQKSVEIIFNCTETMRNTNNILIDIKSFINNLKTNK